MTSHWYTSVTEPFDEGNMIVAGLPKQVSLECNREREREGERERERERERSNT